MNATARTSPHDATVSAVGGAMGWSVITRILQFGLSLVGSILVVRWLGPDRYGLLTVLKTSLAFVTAICGLGLGQALLRYFPAARAAGDRGLAARLVRWTALPQMLTWLLMLLAVWLFRGTVARIAFPEVSQLFLLGTALVIAELAFQSCTNLTTAFYDTRGLSAVTLGGALLYLILVWAALSRGFDVAGALVSTAISSLAMAGYLAVRLRGRLRSMTPAPAAAARREGDTSARTVVRYALPFGAIAVMNLITWRQSETIMLAHFRTMRESGFFDLAYRIPQMILEFVPGAIWPLLMAGFSEIYSRDREKLNRAISVYYKLLFLLVAPISVVGAALGDRALVAFYGQEMAPAGPFCQCFFIIFSLSFLSTPLSMAFYVLERPWVSFLIYLINSTAVIGLDLLLIPRFGLVGAVLPMALILAASPFLNHALLVRCGVRPQIPWGFLGRVYLAAVPCALLYPARLVINGKVPVAAAAALALALYVLGLRFMKVMGPEEGVLIHRSGVPFRRALMNLLGVREAPEC